MIDNSDYYFRLFKNRLVALSPEQGSGPQQSRSRWTTLVSTQSIRRLIDHHRNGSPGGVLAAFETEFWMGVLLVYEEEVGLQYPFLDLDELRHQIKAAKQDVSNSGTEGHNLEMMKSRKREHVEDIAMLVLTVVSTLANPAAIDMVDPLAEEVFTGAVARSQLNTIDQDDLTVLILNSIYFCLSDREILAWRGIGTVMRLLQELSCNSSDDLWPKPSSNQPKDINEKLYWSAYTLDRRWSFGTGLPFAVQDADINRHPSFTDDSLSSAYLKHMIAYCKIASEVRRSILDHSLSLPATSESRRDFLNFRVVQWQRNLPQRLQFRGIEDRFELAKEKRGEYRLRLTLYLRANQMRTVIYRNSALQSGPSSFNQSSVNDMAKIAQDTIRILVGLERTTDIYRTQHRTFNHFLETAISSLLLICYAGSMQTVSCLQDVVAAMELAKQLSSQSPITRRLSDKLKGIHEYLNSIPAEGQESSQSSHPPGIPEKAINLREARQDAGYGNGTPIEAARNSASQDRPDMLIYPSASASAPDSIDPQGSPTRSSLSYIGADSQSTDTVAAGSTTACQDLDPGLQEVVMQGVPLDIMNTNDHLNPLTFPSISYASSQIGLGTTLPADFDFSQAVEFLQGNVRALCFPELGEILWQYENFSF
ncbi:hypothetical protein NW765_017659 [Fusarium oxysporum]|nr:hypothetical protein NW765_017659 [Fusarium oxysporum]KAJ4264581.1 hypothetical protein NW764_015912 [Fusarium oxysporum]